MHKIQSIISYLRSSDQLSIIIDYRNNTSCYSDVYGHILPIFELERDLLIVYTSAKFE